MVHLHCDLKNFSVLLFCFDGSRIKINTYMYMRETVINESLVRCRVQTEEFKCGINPEVLKFRNYVYFLGFLCAKVNSIRFFYPRVPEAPNIPRFISNFSLLCLILGKFCCDLRSWTLDSVRSRLDELLCFEIFSAFINRQFFDLSWLTIYSRVLR